MWSACSVSWLRLSLFLSNTQALLQLIIARDYLSLLSSNRLLGKLEPVVAIRNSIPSDTLVVNAFSALLGLSVMGGEFCD